MRILFIGSGTLACPALEAVLRRPGDRLVGLVAQPDRPRGRKLQPAACPAKAAAERLGVPVFTPEKASDPAFIAAMAELKPDLLIVAAYGQMLKQALLDIAPLGAINIHPSLLPKYRGAAPIQWAIANGDTETGVCILYVTARMDAGDIILCERAAILPDDTAGTLEPRLAALGAHLLLRAIDRIASGDAPHVPQDEAKVVLAPKLRKEDGLLDWSRPAETLRNRIRGFHPWPCCHAVLPCDPPMTLRIHAAAVEEGAAEPGRIVEAGPRGLRIGTGAGILRLTRVQPEGKPVMDATAFVCGHREIEGMRL